MFEFFKNHFTRDPVLNMDESQIESLTQRIVCIVGSPEFAELYARQIGHSRPALPDLGLGDEFNQKMRLLMTAFVDAMTALGQKFAALGSVDPAHLAAIDTHLATLDTEVATLQTDDATDTAAISDTQAGLQAFITAANATAPTPAPSPAPAS